MVNVPRGQSFRFLDCVPSVCLDMMNTSRLAAQCIRFYERPPRKRKMSERKQSDSGGERERERERRSSLEKGWEGEEGTGSSDREGRFYYVILLMHSVLGDPRASNVPRKNIMFLRSENRPWKNPFMPFHLHSTEFHLYILRCKSQTKPFNPLTLKLSIFLFSFYNLSLLCIGYPQMINPIQRDKKSYFEN